VRRKANAKNFKSLFVCFAGSHSRRRALKGGSIAALRTSGILLIGGG